MKAKLLTALIAIAVSSTAIGQTITTIGNIDCGKWIKRKNHPMEELRTISWLSGFMTGLNFGDQFRNDPLKRVSADQIALWMDNYCRANPLRSVANGGEILMMELSVR